MLLPLLIVLLPIVAAIVVSEVRRDALYRRELRRLQSASARRLR